MRKKMRMLIVALLAMSLALSACSSSSSSSSDTTAAAEAATTAASDTEAADESASDETAADDTEAVATGEPLGDETFNYILGHGAAEESVGDLYCKKFKELVEAKSGGSITVDVYSGSSLGTYAEMLISLQNGDIGGMIFQQAPAVSTIPELACLDIPYAFLGMDTDKIDQVLNDSAYSELLEEAFSAANYHFVSFTQAGTYREVTSNKALNTVEDFSGLSIRTLENNNHIAFWEAIGASPTPLAFSDLYLSLQQGLVDAQENPYDTAYAANFMEVQDYLVETHHILYANLFIVDQSLYESMPESYQAVFDEAAAEAKEYAAELMAESNDTFRQYMIDAGMEVIELDDSVLQELSDIGQPVVKELVTKSLGEDVVNTFYESLE